MRHDTHCCKSANRAMPFFGESDSGTSHKKQSSPGPFKMAFTGMAGRLRTAIKHTLHNGGFFTNCRAQVIALAAIPSAAFLHLRPARVLKRPRSLPEICGFDLVQRESHGVNQGIG